jgi:hypothetical protein
MHICSLTIFSKMTWSYTVTFWFLSLHSSAVGLDIPVKFVDTGRMDSLSALRQDQL